MRIVVHILANSLAIFIASRLVSGFIFNGTIPHLIIAGIILGICNSIVKPILKIISFPLIVLTFGLFHIVINLIILFLAERFTPWLEIQTFWAAIWGIIIISLTNNIISSIYRRLEKTNYAENH